MASLRTVRALQEDLSDESINVLLIDIHSDVGAKLRQEYRVRVTPTYIILDNAKTEQWRGNTVPSKSEILQRVPFEP
ncbi:MAG: hypothetical protein CUN55_01470 [Phototrophicales bacterium]|nr:MAG: hypothetical protein CUN55_01470 [Phototrophicales bacterium]